MVRTRSVIIMWQYVNTPNTPNTSLYLWTGVPKHVLQWSAISKKMLCYVPQVITVFYRYRENNVQIIAKYGWISGSYHYITTCYKYECISQITRCSVHALLYYIQYVMIDSVT